MVIVYMVIELYMLYDPFLQLYAAQKCYSMELLR